MNKKQLYALVIAGTWITGVTFWISYRDGYAPLSYIVQYSIPAIVFGGIFFFYFRGNSN